MPGRFRHFPRLHIRYQSFDLTVAYLVDKKTGQLLSPIYPQDKVKNAAGFRRIKEFPNQEIPPPRQTADPVPPLLKKLLADYAATGLPPAYLPKDEMSEQEERHDP